MSKVGIVIVVAAIFISSAAFGQSILDSVFGSSGLGLWGTPQAGSQFDDPRYYSGNANPSLMQQAPQPSTPGYHQGYTPYYPQQAYGYGQPQYYQQQQYPQAPYQTGAQPPVTQYGPGPVQAAPQAPPSVQSPATRSSAKNQRRTTSARRSTATSPQETGGKFGDPLPPGAVRITTSTPEGTIVQYYPPAGTAENEQTYGQRPRPRAAASRVPKQEQQAARDQSEPVRSSIAMPKPVPIPQGQDPRTGWTPSP